MKLIPMAEGKHPDADEEVDGGRDQGRDDTDPVEPVQRSDVDRGLLRSGCCHITYTHFSHIEIPPNRWLEVVPTALPLEVRIPQGIDARDLVSSQSLAPGGQVRDDVRLGGAGRDRDDSLRSVPRDDDFGG